MYTATVTDEESQYQTSSLHGHADDDDNNSFADQLHLLHKILSAAGMLLSVAAAITIIMDMANRQHGATPTNIIALMAALSGALMGCSMLYTLQTTTSQDDDQFIDDQLEFLKQQEQRDEERHAWQRQQQQRDQQREVREQQTQLWQKDVLEQLERIAAVYMRNSH